MITTSFKNAVRDLKGERDKLTGPKGCGKTFFVVVMFCLCWLKDIPCMLLSPESFDFSSNLCCSDFFNLFLNKHIEDEEEQVELADAIEKKDAITAWTLAVNKARNLIIFADLEFYTNSQHVTKKLQPFINILKQKVSSNIRFILAVSSGSEHLTQQLDREVCRDIQYILNAYDSVNMRTGFTEQEASTFVKKLNVKVGDNTVIKLENVVHITGTSPLLLSWLKGKGGANVEQFVWQYSFYVDTELNVFLTSTSPDLVKHPATSVQHFLAYQEVIEGKKFAYAATSGEELNTKELQEYYDTWLHKNLITVLEQPMDLDEQGSSNSTQEVTAGASKVLLRWNFPTMRTVFFLLHNIII